MLFYVLLCQKNPTVHDVRALIFNLPTATADYYFEKGVRVLEKASAAVQPAQQFADLAEFLACFRHHPHLTLDVTEIYVQRPQNKERQKEIYSGKKRHTYKFLLIKGEGGRILYVSTLYAGTVNDYTILKKEFPPAIHWFENKEVRVDLGFQGFAADYRCQRVRIPHKRKRVAKGECNALTAEQVACNKEAASERVVVEHCIGR